MRTDNTRALVAARKSKGSIGKVIEMIENGAYCVEIIQQIDACIGLIKSAREKLLENHLNNCLEHKIKENKTQTIEELVKIYSLKD